MKLFVTTFVALLFSVVVAPGLTPAWGNQADSVRVILGKLDEAIGQKDEYLVRKHARIQDLRRSLERTADPEGQYGIYKKLFEEYLHFQADSAVYYLNRRARLLPIEGHADWEEEVRINRAAVLGVMGLYADALHLLKGIDADSLGTDLRMTYYHVCRTCYGWLADYTIEKREKQKYLADTDLYRDSIMLFASKDLDRDIARAEKAALGGQPDEAVTILQQLLKGTDDMEILSYLNYTMYEAYAAKGDADRQIYYLARTALWDMERVVREYASLHKLARLLYEQGDIDRAYAYLNCSMEDAVACHARLRSLEVTEIYPIIDKAYKAKAAHEQIQMKRAYMLPTVGLVAGYTYYGNIKMKGSVATANGAMPYTEEFRDGLGALMLSVQVPLFEWGARQCPTFTSKKSAVGGRTCQSGNAEKQTSAGTGSTTGPAKPERRLPVSPNRRIGLETSSRKSSCNRKPLFSFNGHTDRFTGCRITKATGRE